MKRDSRHSTSFLLPPATTSTPNSSTACTVEHGEHARRAGLMQLRQHVGKAVALHREQDIGFGRYLIGDGTAAWKLPNWSTAG